MCNILLVSHSHDLAKATYDFVKEMKTKPFELDFIGGIEDGKAFGTNPMEINEKIQKMISGGKHLLIIYDLGSSFLNSQTAVELLMDEEDKKRIAFASVAFVEGSLIAVCSNNDDATCTSLKDIVEQQIKVNK